MLQVCWTTFHVSFLNNLLKIKTYFAPSLPPAFQTLFCFFFLLHWESVLVPSGATFCHVSVFECWAKSENRWIAGVLEGLEFGCFMSENWLTILNGSLLFGNFYLTQPAFLHPGLFNPGSATTARMSVTVAASAFWGRLTSQMMCRSSVFLRCSFCPCFIRKKLEMPFSLALKAFALSCNNWIIGCTTWPNLSFSVWKMGSM